MNQLLKLLIEAGPIILFFIANGQWGLMTATAIFMAAMIVSMGMSYALTKHIPLMLWISVFLVLVFGGATLYFDDELFIKLKPTILYGLFSVTLMFGYLTKRPLIKTLFESGFPPLADIAWHKMTRNWGLFFAAMALLNEYIWRNYATDTWIASKLAVFLPLSLVFAMAQTPLILKYQQDDDTDDSPSAN
ncbi:MAG: septation protein A [Kordiimonas sp.]|nr:septation protein A [Kordiimonas sp.]